MAILITHTNLAGILYISLFIIAITILFSVRLNDDWIRNQIRNSRGEKIIPPKSAAKKNSNPLPKKNTNQVSRTG